jgi:hypothetical protein
MNIIQTFLRSNWRILAACAGTAIVVFLLVPRNRNDHRFIHDGPQILDTRTGQFCTPWPKGDGDDDLPRCADLAKSWR